MNRQNALMCGYETLGKITGLSRQSLYKSVKYLKEHNWIQVVKVGTANAYIVNSKVFWQSYGNQKMTVFHATVIASSDEQDEPIENWDSVKLKNFPFLSGKEELVLVDEKLAPPDQKNWIFTNNLTLNPLLRLLSPLLGALWRLLLLLTQFSRTSPHHRPQSALIV